MTEAILSTWTIYESPADAVGQWVLRQWEIHAGRDPVPCEATQHPSLQKAREAVPHGLHRLNREPGDDPTIVETWI